MVHVGSLRITFLSRGYQLGSSSAINYIRNLHLNHTLSFELPLKRRVRVMFISLSSPCILCLEQRTQYMDTTTRHGFLNSSSFFVLPPPNRNCKQPFYTVAQGYSVLQILLCVLRKWDGGCPQRTGKFVTHFWIIAKYSEACAPFPHTPLTTASVWSIKH